MKTIKLDPFPHEDGAPASWQDNRDAKAAEASMKQSQHTAMQFMKMLMSTMK